MDNPELLLRHLEREKEARLEAEKIGERKINELYNLARSLQTTLKELENQKRQTELEAHQANMLNNIIESSIEYSIISTDLSGTILTWNAGAKNNYGYEPHEIVGQSFSLLHTPEDIQSNNYLRFLEAVQKHGKAEGVFDRIKKSGERFIASAVISLRKDVSGNPLGYLLISRDITQKKILEDQLKINRELDNQNKLIREANKLKSEFIANMSHELRTPLNSIIGFSELIYANELGPTTPEQQSALEDILNSGKDLLRLIEDILDISKIESGKIIFYPEKINLSTLINDVINSLSPIYTKKQITLSHLVTNEVTTVDIDPNRFKQILYNYLSNAIKFSPDHGNIAVRVFAENDDFFRLEVEDHGIGIKNEDLPKLFVEFQQLDSTLAKRYKGTGLGLSVTKNLVEAQGGRVSVSSTPGKGSIFYATLPRHATHLGD